MRRLLSLIFVLCLAGCAGLGEPLEKPRVTLAGLELESLNLFEQRFQVALRLSNPNPLALTVDGVEFDLALNGQPFAHGLSRETVTLPAQGETVVKLKVSTQLGTLWKQLRALQGGGQPLGYQLNGRLFVPWLPGACPLSGVASGRRPSCRRRRRPANGCKPA